MKKILLLLTSGLLVITANGQSLRQDASKCITKKVLYATTSAADKTTPAAQHSGARTTTSTFVTENFGSGAPGVLPTGWTAGTVSGGTWKWTNHASTSPFTMGAMMSTTAANGWMIFDSDSIGTACSCAPSGWLQSPAYNCSAHPWVRLNFEDYYRKFQDSCYVWVSTSPTFTTAAKFPVLVNNKLATNIYSANPENAQIDISSAAGGQSAVYIRFVTSGPNLGAYSWMIDDMSLSTLDSIDISVSDPWVFYNGGSGVQAYTFGSIPLKMVQPVSPETFVNNFGFTNEPAAPVVAKIYQGTTSVYSASVAVTAPRDAYDSLADFSRATPASYTPTVKGLYTVSFGANLAGDAVTANNTDTTYFAVTDSTWSENVPGSGSISSQFVYRPGTSANKLSYSPATQFIVPVGQVDTLTSVSVAFGRSTKAGQVVGAQIYHYDGTNWVYDGLTQFRALTSADISTSALITMADFAVDIAGSGGNIILNGGTGGVSYAVVVKGSNNTDSVTVLEGNNPGPNALIGYTGLADTSNNDGGSSQQFGQGHLPYGNETTPFINMNFGPVPVVIDHTGINNVGAGNYIGRAYPNPANSAVFIPFTLSHDAVVTITLSNMIGQVLNTETITAYGGKSSRATLNTANLPQGVYIYSFDVNGQHATGRIAVTH